MTTSILRPANLLGGGTADLPTFLDNVGTDLRTLGLSNGNTTTKDVVDLPGELTGLNHTTGNVADIISDAGSVSVYTGQFLDATSDNLGDALEQPLETTANRFVKDFHNYIEQVTDTVGGANAGHGITNLGETIGLGHIGEGPNLITDTVGLLDCDPSTGSLSNISHDLQNIATAAPGPVSGLITDLGPGPFTLGILGPGGIVGGSGLDLGNLSNVSHDPVGTLVDNVTHVLDPTGAAGSGGPSDIITDTLNVPGELLPNGGPTPSLTDLGHDLNSTLIGAGDSQPVTGILDPILGSGGESGGDCNPLGGVLQTVGQVLSGGDPVCSVVSDLGHDLGLGSIGGGGAGSSDPVTGILDPILGSGGQPGGDGGPVGGVLQTVGQVLSGGDPACSIVSDLGHDLGLGSTGGGGGSSDPITGIISHLPIDGGLPTDILGGITDGGLGSVLNGGGLCGVGGIGQLPVGAIGDVVATIASLGCGCLTGDVLGGDHAASGSAAAGGDVHSGGLLAGGTLDLSDVGAVLHGTPIGDIANANLDLDQLTNHVNLFDIGHGDLLSSQHHA